jgi:hypothetical protein
MLSKKLDDRCGGLFWPLQHEAMAGSLEFDELYPSRKLTE